MPEYLDDPSQLTKEKLKSELLANNVELPSGNPTKDVYVQLYLKNLTIQNKKHVPAATLDAFSSDEELPPPVLSNRSRSSGRKATRKTDKARPDELDVTVLTDEGLRDELRKHGVDVGPIVASTRKLYEKKLQKLLDDTLAQPPMAELVVTEIQVNLNGNSESEIYSDKEDEEAADPEPMAEPEPAPVVERPIRSRGRPQSQPAPAAVSTRRTVAEQLNCQQNMAVTHIVFEQEWDCVAAMPKGQQQKKTSFLSTSRSSKGDSSTQSTELSVIQVEKIAASEQVPKVEANDVLKELFPNDINSPTGITATCRRPIRGAAGRPIKASDLRNDENYYFSPKTTKTISNSSIYTESHIVNRVSSLPPSTNVSTSSSRLLSVAPATTQAKAARRGMSVWIKLFLLAIVATFLFLVYQAMETNTINPFAGSDTAVSTGSTA